MILVYIVYNIPCDVSSVVFTKIYGNDTDSWI